MLASTQAMVVSPLMWVVTVAALCGVLVFDGMLVKHRPHIPGRNECIGFVAFYVSLAVAFGAMIWLKYGFSHAQEFVAAWVTEYSLSLDNLFIFLLIMTKHKVPRELQQFTLMIGIVLALVLRGIFIAMGTVVIEHLAWVFFIFGAYLIHTAIGVLREYRAKDEGEDEHAGEDGRFVLWLKRRLGCTNTWEGNALWVRREGKLMATLVFFTCATLGGTDLIFALDSIPAIFGLTSNPYIVFAASVFALMGLRQLFFLLEHLVENLRFLPVGLFFLLSFIGVKLLFHASHEYGLDERFLGGANLEISTGASLGFIFACLGLTAIFSLVLPKQPAEAEPAPVPQGALLAATVPVTSRIGVVALPGMMLKARRMGWTSTY